MIFNIEEGSKFDQSRKSYFNAAEAIISLDSELDLQLRMTDKKVYIRTPEADGHAFLSSVYNDFNKKPDKKTTLQIQDEDGEIPKLVVFKNQKTQRLFSGLVSKIKQKMEASKIQKNTPDANKFTLN